MSNYLLSLAFKNIIRAKRRTVLTFLMLSFGVAIYIFLMGMMDGFDRSNFKNSIEFETGHFKILKKNYDKDRPYDKDNIIMDPSKVISVLKNNSDVTGYAQRLQFIGEIDNGKESTSVITIGVAPEQDRTVYNVKKYIEKGGFARQGVILGKTLAKDMGVNLNSMVYISFKDYAGQTTSMELYVTGIINSPYAKINNGTAFILLSEAQEGMGVEGVSEISVMTNVETENLSGLKKVVVAISSKLPGFICDRWDQQNEGIQGIMKMKKKFSSMFALFIIMIGGVGVVNTMLISVLEKQREIGTLKALGMQDGEVRNLFIFEGLVIGIMGSLFGLILGSLFNAYPAIVGIDFTSMAGGETAFMGVIKSIWPVKAYFIAFILATVASVLASWYPAKKVLKMQPVECLRTIQ